MQGGRHRQEKVQGRKAKKEECREEKRQRREHAERRAKVTRGEARRAVREKWATVEKGERGR